MHSTPLNIPDKLCIGDTIGIICPSAGISPKAAHRIEQAQRMLEKMGYQIKLGRYIYSDNYTSGSIAERVSDIHAMFLDKEVRMILAGIGGNHSNQVIRFLDYELIKQNPKIFCGYSDITVLHYALYTQANLASFYGPCAATQFGEFPEIIKYTRDSFLDEVASDSIAPRRILKSSYWTDEFLDWFQKLDTKRARIQQKSDDYIWLRDGASEGEALPACNMTLNRLAGTEFWINPAGKILVFDLLLSEGELNYPLLDASITDLFNVGLFDKLNGLILSRPTGFSKDEVTALYNRILELTEKTSYPILANFDIGHSDPINTIRYGRTIRLDSLSNTVEFK